MHAVRLLHLPRSCVHKYLRCAIRCLLQPRCGGHADGQSAILGDHSVHFYLRKFGWSVRAAAHSAHLPRSCALLVGVGVLVWLMPRYSGSWQMSVCRCRHPGVRPRQGWIVLRVWLVSSVTAVAVRPLFCFVMAATGVITGAA